MPTPCPSRTREGNPAYANQAVDRDASRSDHAAMDFEDAVPRARPDDLIAQLVLQDLDRLSVSELDERIITLTAEIERTRKRRDASVNHKASADALFKK